MSDFGILAAIISALLQAIVHGIWKTAGDKLVIRAVIGGCEALLVLPLLFFLPLPTRDLWVWLCLSVITHIIYQLVLIKAYEGLDFSVAYPLARGTVPVVTAVLGILVLGDSLSLIGFLSIVMISVGLLILAWRNRPKFAALLSALAAGLLTSAYSLVDAYGVRVAEAPMVFIVWFFLLEGVVIMTVALWRRGAALSGLIRTEGRAGVVGAILSVIGYGAVLLAFSIAPAGAVAALRETSVAFAGLYAFFVLKEQIQVRRILAMSAILVGAAVLSLAG